MNDKKITAGQDAPTEISDNKMHTAEAEMDKGIGNISDNFGKFKDAKGLLEAYNSLQSEFTRRCQKVSELEREIEKLKNSEQVKNIFENILVVGECDGFLSTFPEAKQHIKSLYDIAESKGDESYGRLERAYIDKLLKDLKSQREYFTSKDYFNSVLERSDDLKREIIRGYLDEIYATKSSAPLISGDGKLCITPPSNPKSIFEAGNLAKQIFDNYKENL